MTATAKKISPPSLPVPSPGIVRARDIMTPDPFTLDGKMRVIDAAELMIAHGTSNAPVVYADFSRKMLAGFVSEQDPMQCYASGRLAARPLRALAPARSSHAQAAGSRRHLHAAVSSGLTGPGTVNRAAPGPV